MHEYYARVADDVLNFKLRTSGAVLIKGTKWCGKSTTAEQVADSAVYLQDAQNSSQSVALAQNAPGLLLEGATPRLIDEWQVVPSLWDQVRFEVDHRPDNGQFILTGSATPPPDDGGEDPYMHSGIGRISTMVMRPMSLFESRDSTGAVSLSAMFDGGELAPSTCDLAIEDYAYLTCRGGWPRMLGLDREEALEQAYVFYDGLVNHDIDRTLRGHKNPERIKRFMRAYARAVSTETSVASIRDDMSANEGMPLAIETVTKYVNAMERLYVIENMPAWNPNLRSKTAIRTTATRHFVDPSIAAAALGLGPGSLLADMNTFGLLFESMCVRDLRVYAEAIKGTVHHYRDKRGREVDAVVHLRDGRWGLAEVKLASPQAIDEAAEHLLTIERDIDADRMGRASFLMVLTATGAAYARPDGVCVVPIGCLMD